MQNMSNLEEGGLQQQKTTLGAVSVSNQQGTHQNWTTQDCKIVAWSIILNMTT